MAYNESFRGFYQLIQKHVQLSIIVVTTHNHQKYTSNNEAQKAIQYFVQQLPVHNQAFHTQVQEIQQDRATSKNVIQ